MMTTLERKKLIKEKIDISDESVLEKIEKILEEDIYILSDEQLLRLKEAKAEYNKGKFTSQELEAKEMEEWFREQEK
ncbi:hypothetical protein LUD75_15030 [Epilithonimonas sp. JDS]|uniref:hypothetical protein n=1 Tax=Epilithonimonas sp. JDS TaxID=2902797 RepID=UPI001E5C8298|nr:hypothetical protein [Epilithonimonas sp. JDS]MCD9856037.1 hypothetical protein [Epilithonimonas sp. JDS]